MTILDPADDSNPEALRALLEAAAQEMDARDRTLVELRGEVDASHNALALALGREAELRERLRVVEQRELRCTALLRDIGNDKGCDLLLRHRRVLEALLAPEAP